MVDSQDILVYCEGGIVQSCRLVLACLSPLLRSILLQAEEPSIILPGVQVVHEVQVDYGGQVVHEVQEDYGGQVVHEVQVDYGG